MVTATAPCPMWLPLPRRTSVSVRCCRTGRTPLTLAVSANGLAWSRVWSVRGFDTLPPVRYHGFPGFQYPSGLWIGEELLLVYSVNKEDIALTRIALKDLA